MTSTAKERFNELAEVCIEYHGEQWLEAWLAANLGDDALRAAMLTGAPLPADNPLWQLAPAGTTIRSMAPFWQFLADRLARDMTR
ncbi:MAG: hypothetical protein LJE59_07115 [Chromatiaceae bacterium]|nr:hypothetical protein [Chromatiaceae bacterium]